MNDYSTEDIFKKFGDKSRACFNSCRIIHSETLSKCGGCKIAVYCSKLCQKEHWLSTHKKHCNFLNGKRKLPEGSFHHNEKKCYNCITTRSDTVEENKVCPYTTIKDSTEGYKIVLYNALMFYTNTNNDPISSTSGYTLKDYLMLERMNLPFQLGEFTGTYEDRIDQSLGEIVVLVVKIMNSNFEQK